MTTHLCKLLFMAPEALRGFTIRTINVMPPICTDDMILMTSSALQLQVLILLATTYVNEEHYMIHPEKTVILPYNTSSKPHVDFLKIEKPWTTNGTPIPVKDELDHLDIRRIT